MARPSSFAQKTADIICERIANGESLRNICLDDDMPDLSTARRWLAKPEHETFRLQYARAREDQADYYADDIIDIADTETDPQKARVRIDARKWKASKLAPKKYGDKTTLAGDSENPIAVTEVVRRIVRPDNRDA